MNFLLKANWGRDRRSAFLVFWSALKCKLGGKGRGGGGWFAAEGLV